MTDASEKISERVPIDTLDSLYEMAGTCAVKGKLLRELIDEIRQLRAEHEEMREKPSALRRSVQDAADLLIELNKQMHARNPEAVTAIDMWLAERAVPAAQGASRGTV